jgi:tetratricopeptide (TPR) repeat protein
VHQYLKRLSGISALVIGSALAGPALAQNSTPPAQNGQAAHSGQAPAAHQKKYKDKGEYDLYSAVTKEQDNNKKLELLNTWRQKYPESDFKMERLQLYLVTYQHLGQSAKMIETAKEILAMDPKDLQALYWIAFLTPTLGSNSPDALDLAQKAANGLLNAEKPANVKEEDWTKAKALTDAIADSTLGWIAMQRKNYPVAEQNFKKSLEANPNAAQVSYWLGTTILAEKKPERQSEALYDFARAAAYDGPGSLTPQGRQQVNDYLTKAYKTLHGDTSGLDGLKAQAKAAALPPPDFKILSAAEVEAAKEEELRKNNPQLALWLGIKGQLQGADGQAYFDNNMKGTEVKGLKGWILSAKPAVRSKELLLSMEGKDHPGDVTLKLEPALTGKPDTDMEVTFDGIPDSFTKDPFMLTFTTDKSKITGLKEEKAPVRRPVHHRR